METEIKLRFLEKEGKEQILANKWIRSLEMPDSINVKEYRNVYYDTRDRVLEKQNAVFRVRYDNEGLITATVKISNSVSEGLHQRMEWSVDLEEDKVDIDYFLKMADSDGDPEHMLIKLMKSIKGDDLVEICSTEFERTTLHLGYEDTLIELACDCGVFISGRTEEPFSELELELIEGDTRALLDLSHEISKIVSVVPENKSKYGRCLELNQNGKH